MVHFKRGLECLNTLLFCVYNESSTFYIFMLYVLIHTVLAVEFVVVLWNRVSLNKCLFVSVCLLSFLAIYIHVVFLSWFCAVRVAVCCVCCVSCMNSSLSFTIYVHCTS